MKPGLNIKGGVMIMGSLLWQSHLKTEKNDNIRSDWRNNHLSIDEKILVKIPIRYGRLSQSNIYTMVLSNNCCKKKNGTGYIVPFKNKNISTLEELMSESTAISIAEGMKGHFVSKERGTENIWCSLGILFNPKYTDIVSKKNIIEAWKEKIKLRGSLNPKIFKRGWRFLSKNPKEKSGEKYENKWYIFDKYP